MQKKTCIYLVLSLLCISIISCQHFHLHKANFNPSLCNASNDNTCDWMQQLLRNNPKADVTLTNICLPGAHDAGMYSTQFCQTGANTGNTQTQYLNMQHMLEAGIRIFDVRPVLFKNAFYTEHCTRCDGIGCKGDRLDSILKQTRTFVDNHAEVVILVLTHFCHSSPADSALWALLNNSLGDRIYKVPSNGNASLIHIPLRDILPANASTGKVILTLEGIENNATNRALGFFSPQMLPGEGGWTNDHILSELTKHQLQNFANYKGNGDALFTIAWQMTQATPQAVRCAFNPNSYMSIKNLTAVSNKYLPPLLDSLIKAGSINKGKIPNIIWGDFADTMVAHQCIRLSKLSVE